MYKIKNIGISLILLLITISISYSQEIPDPAPTEVTELELGALDLNTKVNLAITTPDYPVTPGDIYILNFFNSIISKSIILRVSSDGSVDISSFGLVNSKGMLFTDFIKVVKSKIDESYEGTHTQITIRSVGSFQVQIKGEVKESRMVSAWGLSRLSEIVYANKTGYASIRDVTVIDSDNKEHHYDLFRSKRLGQLDQDPYVQPGDKIILSKYKKQVNISGEVRRPGTYQLLPGDTLADLLEAYGDGLTPYADGEIEITRWQQADTIPRKVIYLSSVEKDFREFEITNLDSIKVNSKASEHQIVFFEGAVDGSSSSVIKYAIRDGELLSTAIRSLEDKLPKEADLENTYIERISESRLIPVNLIELLYNNNNDSDLVLIHDDRIVIPFRQYFVNISGEVNSPGRYAYIPNRSWSYYVNMAGGFNNLTHSGNKIQIFDYKNKEKDTENVILPEDTIIAPNNDILDNVNRYTVFIGVVSSVVTSILTVSLLMGQ